MNVFQVWSTGCNLGHFAEKSHVDLSQSALSVFIVFVFESGLTNYLTILFSDENGYNGSEVSATKNQPANEANLKFHHDYI